jgi:hypothetical protein
LKKNFEEIKVFSLAISLFTFSQVVAQELKHEKDFFVKNWKKK